MMNASPRHDFSLDFASHPAASPKGAAPACAAFAAWASPPILRQLLPVLKCSTAIGGIP